LIGRDKGTISRELRRNALPKSGYAPLSAERIAFAPERVNDFETAGFRI
jgi:IS30 family transposase